MATKNNGKASKATKATKGGEIIVIGSKGCAFPVTAEAKALAVTMAKQGENHTVAWPSPKAAGTSYKECVRLNSLGKSSPAGMENADLVPYVGARGGAIRLVALSVALSKGFVREVKLEISRDGNKPRIVSAYTTAKKGEKLSQYLATADLPSGRIETLAVHDKEGNRAGPHNWHCKELTK